MSPKAALDTLFLIGVMVILFILIVGMLGGAHAGVRWIGRRLAPEPAAPQPCPWCPIDAPDGASARDCNCGDDCGEPWCRSPRKTGRAS